MNIGAIIAATVLVAAVGLFIGVFLGVSGKKFAVEVDEKEVAVREALPWHDEMELIYIESGSANNPYKFSVCNLF